MFHSQKTHSTAKIETGCFPAYNQRLAQYCTYSNYGYIAEIAALNADVVHKLQVIDVVTALVNVLYAVSVA